MNFPKVVLTHATGISHTSSKNSPKVVRPVAPVAKMRASRTGARKISNATWVGPTATSAGGLALAVLCAQQFIMAYDTISMNVANSTIGVGLNTSLPGVQSAIAMYAS